MRGSFWIIALTIVFTLAGCLDSADSGSAQGRLKQAGAGGKVTLPISDAWAEAVFTVGNDHNHRDMAQHQGLSTPNFEILGHNSLSTDYHGKPAGGYFCGDTQARGDRVLSIVHSWVSDVALVISDVTDPTNPQKLGELVMANTHVYDLAMSPDQRYVFLATSPGNNAVGNDPGGGGLPPIHDDSTVYFRDECTGERRPVLGPEQNLPFASGIVLVDINNPRNPLIQDFRFFPVFGGHSVEVSEVNGRTLILVSVPNPGAPSYYVFMDLAGTPAGSKMNILSTYLYPAQSGPVPGVPMPGGLHDGLIHKHPITGDTLAYLAYGSTSLVILNINNPAQPQFVSRWSDWRVFGEAAPANPFVHETLPIDGTWDGRHYTFIGEECGSRRPKSPTCLVGLLDTTDPKTPTFVGGWTLPVDIQWQGGLQYSLHYLAVVDRTMFATNYHGGLWAIDVSTPEAMRSMPSIGVFMPDRINEKGTVYPNHQYHYTPVVLDANPLPNGNLLVYDGTTGLYVVRFDASQPAPSPAPWPFPFNQG